MPSPKRNNFSSLLYPFSLLYGMAVWFRNMLFDYQFIKSHEFPIPVISVGNITAGGTGKTPVTEEKVDEIIEREIIMNKKTIGFIGSEGDGKNHA